MKQQRFLLSFFTSLCLSGCIPALGQAKVVNGDIAYLRGFVGQKLYSLTPDTNRERQLLPGGVVDSSSDSSTEDGLFADYRKLAWSYDGRWLAYENDSIISDECQISALSVTPTEYRCLVPDRLLPSKRRQSNEVSTFGWSADGRWLALAYLAKISSRNIKTVIALINTEGKPALNKLIVVQGITIGQLEFSPDNRSIVFSAHKLSLPRRFKKSAKLSAGVYLLDVATRKIQRFNGTKQSDYAPAWSPDGSKLAVLSAAANPDKEEAQINIVDPETASRTQITNDRLLKGMLEFSLDGTAFLFSNTEIPEGDDLLTSVVGPEDSPIRRSIYIVQVNGDGLRELIDAKYDTQPAWQPLHVPDGPPPAE